MRRYIYLFTTLALFVIGCSEESNMLSPVNNNVITNEPNWIALPQAEGMQINQEVSTSKVIDGKKGGIISLNNLYSGGPFGKVVVKSDLSFPSGSFSGKIEFTVSYDDSYCVSAFGPSFEFNKDLTYNITYSGINLNGINPSTVKFAYLADNGSIAYAVNDGITVDFTTGTLSVSNAKIPHFSRYGFVN